MYTIETTPGFIIESRSSGEAGRVLSIFTRDLGLIRASAQGIRLEKSKLRYFAQTYSFGVYSLVRGREYWRLTSTAGYESASGSRLELSPSGKELMVRVSLILRRLLHGEEPHPELFSHVEACAVYASENKNMSSEAVQGLESLTIWRMLHAMGYIAGGESSHEFVGSGTIDNEIVMRAYENKREMNREINKALKESHL